MEKEYPVKRRRAFTMLEMLVVMSIIAFLAAIGILAYSHVSRSVAASATTSTLHQAQSLLGEYDSTTGIANLGSEFKDPSQASGYSYSKGATYPYIGGKVFDPGPNFPIGAGTGYPAGPVTADFRADEFANPTTALFNTAYTGLLLHRNPAVAAIITKLPPKSLLPMTSQTVTIPGSFGQPSPVLADAWGNPIIFVPAGGLSTTVAGQPALVRTTGVITPFTPANPPPLKPGDRPFWASAGPDGNFDNGDDNLYSFQ